MKSILNSNYCFIDPFKRSWVEESKKNSKNIIKESDFEWVRDVSASVPSWDDREKVDLAGFLIEVAEFNLSILEELNDQGVLEPADDYRMGYTDEEWDEYGFDRWRDVDWKADGMVNTQLDRDSLIFSHDFIYHLEQTNHPKWEFVEWDTTEYNLEHSTHKDRVIVKNKKQDRYFAIYLEGSPWDGVNFDEGSLVEVFPKKITKTIYESKITNKTIVENDFEWASEFNWTKEMLDSLLEDCKPLKVANFNVRTKQPYLSAGNPSIMFLSRCKEWWDYFGSLPLSDSGRGSAEWFSEVTYETGDIGVIWNPSWSRKKITPQLEDLKDDFTSAITTEWGYGIEKQLNGISNSEAWFVVDENNKPIYNLIPNTVKPYAKIYEEEFFGDKLNESKGDDFEWTKETSLNFFDDAFSKENFYSQEDEGPSNYETRNNNVVQIDGDVTRIWYRGEDFDEGDTGIDENYVLTNLMKYDVYSDDYFEFDDEEFNYVTHALPNVYRDLSELLDGIVTKDELLKITENNEFNKLEWVVRCGLFSKIFIEFRDSFLSDWSYTVGSYKSEEITRKYHLLVNDLDFTFEFLQDQWEFEFDTEDFWSYFAENPMDTIEDFLEYKLKPIMKSEISTEEWNNTHPPDEIMRDEISPYYDHFIHKLEELVYSGELKECTNFMSKWFSMGFEFAPQWLRQINKLEIESQKFTSEKSFYSHEDSKTLYKNVPAVYVIFLEDDGEYSLKIELENNNGRNKLISNHEEDGATPTEVKNIISKFEKNKTQKQFDKFFK